MEHLQVLEKERNTLLPASSYVSVTPNWERHVLAETEDLLASLPDVTASPREGAMLTAEEKEELLPAPAVEQKEDFNAEEFYSPDGGKEIPVPVLEQEEELGGSAKEFDSEDEGKIYCKRAKQLMRDIYVLFIRSLSHFCFTDLKINYIHLTPNLVGYKEDISPEDPPSSHPPPTDTNPDIFGTSSTDFLDDMDKEISELNLDDVNVDDVNVDDLDLDDVNDLDLDDEDLFD